jgi:HK97 gp10 family phage protein
MDFKVDVQGLKGVEDALAGLEPKLAKRALRIAMKAATEPIVASAKLHAPLLKGKETKWRRRGELRDSIIATIKTKKHGITAKVGPARNKGEGKQSPGAWGLMVEFGSIHGPAQPYLRPAFDETKDEAIERFTEVIRDSLPELKNRD